MASTSRYSKTETYAKYLGKSISDFNTFQEKITCARINYSRNKKKKGLSLEKAAKCIGITSVYLWQLETGQRAMPSAAVVYNLEKFYGFNYGELASLISDQKAGAANE